jgi:hypothetical protein
MKISTTIRVGVLVFGAFLLLVLVAAIVHSMLFGVGFARTIVVPQGSNDPVLQARSAIPIGTERDVALQELSDAWYHADCRFGDGSGPELFFFGTQEPEKARILEVDYKVVNGAVQVSNIGSLENYMLHLYSYCLPSEMVPDTP